MRIINSRYRIFLILLLVILQATAAKVSWQIKEYRNHKYVPLSQVKDFYNLTSMTKSGSYIILKNSDVELKFRAGGQEVLMNNVKFIFSHAVISLGSYHISIMDLKKVIDPVLRPFKIKAAKGFDTVIIDPGHGGKDPGAVNSLGTEAGYNLKIAKLLQDNLRKRGFKVVMTRSTDVFLTLQERVKLANLYRDAIFISIHFNSVGSRARSQARGIETFTLSPVGVAHYGRGAQASDNIERMGNAQDSANIALATAVHWSSIQLLARAKLEVPDRGIRRARYSVLTGVKHPAILFEGGFMSHQKEKFLINNPTYQRTLAKSMCEAIVFYRKATMQKIGTTKR